MAMNEDVGNGSRGRHCACSGPVGREGHRQPYAPGPRRRRCGRPCCCAAPSRAQSTPCAPGCLRRSRPTRLSRSWWAARACGARVHSIAAGTDRAALHVPLSAPPGQPPRLGRCACSPRDAPARPLPQGGGGYIGSRLVNALAGGSIVAPAPAPQGAAVERSDASDGTNAHVEIVIPSDPSYRQVIALDLRYKERTQKDREWRRAGAAWGARAHGAHTHGAGARGSRPAHAHAKAGCGHAPCGRHAGAMRGP